MQCACKRTAEVKSPGAAALTAATRPYRLQVKSPAGQRFDSRAASRSHLPLIDSRENPTDNASSGETLTRAAALPSVIGSGTGGLVARITSQIYAASRARASLATRAVFAAYVRAGVAPRGTRACPTSGFSDARLRWARRRAKDLTRVDGILRRLMAVGRFANEADVNE